MRRVMNLFKMTLLASAVLTLSSASFSQITTMSNRYVAAQMGVPGAIGVDPLFSPPDYPRGGRWCIWSQEGDPEIAEDNGLPLVTPSSDGFYGPVFRQGFTTIRVDDANIIFGDDTKGNWVRAPYVGSTPYPQGETGPYIKAWYQTNSGRIAVQYRMVLIRDQVRFEIVLTNLDTVSHKVGLRQAANSWSSSAQAHVYIPGKGIVDSEASVTGTDIPSFFEIYDDVKNPKFAIRNTLSLEDATAPDRLAVGDAYNICGSDWDFYPITDRPQRDTAWAVWWNPVVLEPNQSRIIVNYYGMAAASSSWTKNADPNEPIYDCLAVQGPRSVHINYDQNITSDAMIQSNPFAIKAYVYNMSPDVSLSNIRVNLRLPEGLELVEGDATQLIDSVGKESEGPAVTWKVKATGKVCGELKYIVVASGAPSLNRTITRSIVIPATNATNLKPGWQMISVPFKFNDPRLETALNLAADSYEAVRYDPAALLYKDVESVKPGDALWIRSTVDRDSLTVSNNGLPLAGDDTEILSLSEGWNQFGNPYLYNITWGRVKFVDIATGAQMGLQEAIDQSLIGSNIYWWDPEGGNNSTGEYIWSQDTKETIIPWRGYWIKAYKPCKMIMPKIEQAGGGISGTTADGVRSRSAAVNTSSSKIDGWKLQLVAKAGDAVDSKGLLGVSSRASDGFDSTFDVERPPSVKDYVSVSFPHRDWGKNNGNYFSDVRRSSGGTQVWEFNVSTDKRNSDVVVKWPTISAVPKGYSLKLVDVDGSVTKYMRTTSYYRYNSGDGGTRRFKIVAEPGQSGRLFVTGVAVSTSRAVGSATISYNLSADASTDVKIKTISGRTIRSIAQGRAVTRGVSNLSWNYRDEAGNAIPAGSYLLEVVATSPEGEVAKSIRPFLVAR